MIADTFQPTNQISYEYGFTTLYRTKRVIHHNYVTLESSAYSLRFARCRAATVPCFATMSLHFHFFITCRTAGIELQFSAQAKSPLNSEMPFVFIPVAMYVVYKKQQSSELEAIDPAINLEGKTAVRFLPIEHSLGMLETPISTISFFSGNYKEIAPRLKQRVEEILRLNPWLGGWIAKIEGDHQFRLFYDPSGETRAPGAFTMFEPGEVPLSGASTPYSQYEVILEEADLKVKRNKEQFGRNSALWRVNVVPDMDAPGEGFALIVSMSHLVGDGHTFYKLYGMLCQNSDIISISPVRRFDAVDAAEKLMGKEEYHYISKAVSNPLWEWTQNEDNPSENQIFVISKYWLEILRIEHNAENNKDGVKVSDNSLITWWFFNMTKPTVGFMSYNLRNRVQGCGLSDTVAGNYNNPIPYTGVDYATPALIQQSLETGRRCGSNPPRPLPGFKWDATFSLITNWATFYKSNVCLGEDVDELLHMPLQDASEMKMIPSKVTLMCLFNARQGRIGAFINAPRSIMQEVEASGIIDEVITKF